jgi:hypothetical protein
MCSRRAEDSSVLKVEPLAWALSKRHCGVELAKELFLDPLQIMIGATMICHVLLITILQKADVEHIVASCTAPREQVLQQPRP